MKFIKEILRPADYTVRMLDGSRQRRRLTANDLKAMADRFSSMSDKGFLIPAPYAHGTPDTMLGPVGDPKSVPSNLNAGFWTRVWWDKDAKALYGELDAPLKSDAEKISKTIREVSPAIRTFRDGQGNVWENALYHIALVTHPVMHGQENFLPQENADENAAISEVSEGFSLSISDAENLLLPASKRQGTLEGEGGTLMSVAIEKKQKGTRTPVEPKGKPGSSNFKPKKPGDAKPVVDGADEDDEDGDEDEDEDGGDEDEKENVVKDKSGNQLPKPKDGEEEQLEPTDGKPSLPNLLVLLKAFGIAIPEGTTEVNLIDRLSTALEVLTHAEGTHPDQQKKPIEEPLPVAMSLDNGGNDPMEAKFAAFAQKQRTADSARRVEALVGSGRVTPHYAATTLKPMLEGYQLSLDDNGEPVPTVLDHLLSALEGLPERMGLKGGTMTGKDGMKFSFEEQPLPTNLLPEEMTEEKAEEVATAQLTRSGYVQPQKP